MGEIELDKEKKKKIFPKINFSKLKFGLRKKGNDSSQVSGDALGSESSEAPISSKKKNPFKEINKKKLSIFVGGVVLFVVLFLGVFAVGIYKYEWNDKVTIKVAKIFIFRLFFEWPTGFLCEISGLSDNIQYLHYGVLISKKNRS
jgi:hypothetical protein